VTTTKAVVEADRRIKRLGTNAQLVADDLNWIVDNRAWELRGFDNFPDWFKAVHGFAASAELINFAFTLLANRLNVAHESRGNIFPVGYTQAQVGGMLGLSKAQVRTLLRQLGDGVAHDHMVRTDALIDETVAKFGSPQARARARNRMIGKGADELISVGFNVPRRVRDWYRNEAKTAVTPIPDAELYRQVLIAHMDKVEAGRKASRRTSRSRGKAA
jgi:hypothetical protein